MRVLATIAFSFAAGLFLVLLLPWSGWYLWAAAGLALAALGLYLWGRTQKRFRRSQLILWPLAASLVYFTAYQAVVQQPVLDRCGTETAFAGTVCTWPWETERGAAVTVRLHGMHGAKATYYGGEELLTLEPGQTLSGAAWWQDASNIRGTELTQFTARGVYALLYQRDEPEVGQGSAGKLRWLPLRAARAMQERAAAIWDDQSVQGFLIAELTGDRAALPEGDAVVMEETGLAHLFAVSGLHCAFLVTLLGLLTPGNRRRTLCAVTIPALLFYMVMVGLSPSVVRACIMQIFLLTAPLFRRSSDGLTALAAALGVILLANPFSAGSVSLQLSFAAALGMVLLTPRLYQTLSGWYHGQRRLVERMIRFLAANLAATLGAMVFTAPLIAWYFNIFVIVAPLAGLLAVPAAGWSFMAAFITTLLGLVWLPLGQVLGWVSFALVKYILWVARTLTALPFHAVYFNNRILIYWMLYSYIAFIGCAVTKDRRRKYAMAAVLSAMMLAVSVWLGDTGRYGVMNALALDVGQGESVALWSGKEAALVELAARKGTDVVFVTSPTVLTLGEMTLTVYPPVAAEGDLNEQGLSALATAGDFDLLITGDMAGSTERKLAETYPLPDIEVLVVSHHGSRYSSDETFLRAVRPEVGIISVGDNSYGHPSGQAMERLEDIGADIWRTDRQGTVRVTVKGED